MDACLTVILVVLQFDNYSRPLLTFLSFSSAKYEAMLQKLAVIREARESLNDMRAQHREKMRHQELEQEMLRRMQMEQKLELMRQQKQEYLEYQRQLQIQRQQELEIYQQEKLMGRQMAQQMPGKFEVCEGSHQSNA